jgi:hypothetical protein
MSEPFDQPSAPGAGIDLGPLTGALLMINVRGVESGIQTIHGVANAVRVDVDVIDGPGAGQHHDDVLLFPRVLQGQLRGHVGGKVIGRLGVGEAKPGKNAPWLLAPATAADVALGRQFLAGSVASVSATPPF